MGGHQPLLSVLLRPDVDNNSRAMTWQRAVWCALPCVTQSRQLQRHVSPVRHPKCHAGEGVSRLQWRGTTQWVGQPPKRKLRPSVPAQHHRRSAHTQSGAAMLSTSQQPVHTRDRAVLAGESHPGRPCHAPTACCCCMGSKSSCSWWCLCCCHPEVHVSTSWAEGPG